MAAKTKQTHRHSRLERKEMLTGYLFVTPYLIAFIIFTGIPFISAFALSFMNVKFITKLDNVKFVGLKNFARMFASEEVMAALGRTALYSLIYVPVI
ncbi:MAG: sugar ABC transporter permease, partial [Ruthenibacterium sp.]